MADEAPTNEILDTKEPTDEAVLKKRGCCSNTKQFLLYDNHRKDVQAFYFNQFGRAILFISFLFLSMGVLEFAYKAVR